MDIIIKNGFKYSNDQIAEAVDAVLDAFPQGMSALIFMCPEDVQNAEEAMKKWRNELKKTLMSHVVCRRTESRDTAEAMEQQHAKIKQTKRRMKKAEEEDADEKA